MATQSKEYDNNLRGVLFRNNKKTKDSHPDYTGSLEAAGVEYWMSAWTKHGQRGSFLSISLTPKEAQAGAVEDDMMKPTPVGVAEERPFNPVAQDPHDLDGDIPL